MTSTGLRDRAGEPFELRYHSAMPGWCKIMGLRIRVVPECEGGGFAITEPEAEKIVAALNGRALLASPAPAGAEGWVVVPKEPTCEMVIAAHARDRDGTTAMYHKIWAAMIAASPAPAQATEKEIEVLTETQIKHMVDRFLFWKLPENFNPDGGISFKKTFNEHAAHPMNHEPVGTNLFGSPDAEAMVRHMIEGMPPAAATPPAEARELVEIARAAKAYRDEETNGTPRMWRGKQLQDLADELDAALAALSPASAKTAEEI